MIITKHGYKRIKERVGLPKRAHDRHILTVLNNGLLSSYNEFDMFKIIYQGFLYIFSLTPGFEPVLITTHRASKYNFVG